MTNKILQVRMAVDASSTNLPSKQKKHQINKGLGEGHVGKSEDDGMKRN